MRLKVVLVRSWKVLWAPTENSNNPWRPPRHFGNVLKLEPPLHEHEGGVPIQLGRRRCA
jgi:hypothetical protein